MRKSRGKAKKYNGWITGHSYIVYGPLALAASSVIFEGAPTDAGRPWHVAEELDVNIFHTSPTAIRALRRAGPGVPGIYPIIFDDEGKPLPAGAVEAPDGYFRILGRIDDVINVAGHRLGTKELEWIVPA